VRTPAGQDCQYFYGDYHRGRHMEECRLLEGSAEPWRPALCETCPVPGILLANACPNLILYGRIERRMWFWKRMQIVAVCQHTGGIVREPKIGCGHCGDADRERGYD
jgi:hypothetical protein